MDLNEFQREAIKTRRVPAKTAAHDPIVSLLGLAGETGELISEYKKQLRDGDSYLLCSHRVGEELGDLLWYIASVADEFGLTLNEVAQQNLDKTRERWIESSDRARHLFDEAFPDNERLPLRFEVAIESMEIDGQTRVRMLIGDTPIGDPLSDNSHQDDGYRFHDVFHLACAAILGWSPVTRKLLNRKRKSNRRIDEVEDGGRATAVEEGICAMVFSYAADRDFLKGVTNVDYGLLRMIKSMTREFEVNVRPHRDWERVILTSYEIWRHLKITNRGTIAIDLENRDICLVCPCQS